MQRVVGAEAYTVDMSSHVEVSPSGIGFVRTSARKSIPGAPAAAQGARRRSWISGLYESKNASISTTAKNLRGEGAEKK